MSDLQSTPLDACRRPRSAQTTPDDWTVFGWDSFFNALLLATASGELAWSALLAGVESRYPIRDLGCDVGTPSPQPLYPRPMRACRRT